MWDAFPKEYKRLKYLEKRNAELEARLEVATSMFDITRTTICDDESNRKAVMLHRHGS